MSVFIVLASAIIVAALAVITARSPIYSAVAMVMMFFGIGAIYFLLHAPFLAIVHMIVYAGAIMVLFVFMIMMLHLEPDALSVGKLTRFWVGLVVSGGILGILAIRILPHFHAPLKSQIIEPGGEVTTRMIGQVLFKAYVLPFELSTLLFLAAVIGTIKIGRYRLRKGSDQ